MVRQFERPRSRDVAVVLDLWRPDRPAGEHPDNVELAVSFAATVLAEASAPQGGSKRIWPCSTATPECWAGRLHRRCLQGLMERLAVVARPGDDTLPALLAHALRGSPPAPRSCW